jgi:hypothetical protein
VHRQRLAEGRLQARAPPRPLPAQPVLQGNCFATDLAAIQVHCVWTMGRSRSAPRRALRAVTASPRRLAARSFKASPTGAPVCRSTANRADVARRLTVRTVVVRLSRMTPATRRDPMSASRPMVTPMIARSAQRRQVAPGPATLRPAQFMWSRTAAPVSVRSLALTPISVEQRRACPLLLALATGRPPFAGHWAARPRVVMQARPSRWVSFRPS